MNLLLAINTSAGTGHDLSLGSEMAQTLRERLGLGHTVDFGWADGHEAIRERSCEFTRQHTSNAVIIAGGGGGTLRAVIEGVGDSAKTGT